MTKTYKNTILVNDFDQDGSFGASEHQRGKMVLVLFHQLKRKEP